MVEATHHLQVLQSRQILIDSCVLTRQPDALPDLVRLPLHIQAGHFDQALVRLKQSSEDPNRGGLSCSIRSQQPEDRPLRNQQIKAVERNDLAVALHEAFGSNHVVH